ncbi:MAG: 6-bladed beta-propeller [Draconibacterium sp.]
MRAIFVCILLVYGISSCTNVNKKKVETDSQKAAKAANRINVAINSDEIDFSEFFTKAEAIKFEAGFVGSVKKLQIVKDKIILLSGSGTKRVHIYDIGTNEMASIAEIGNGPYQFTSVRDIYTFDNSIYILDFNTKSLHEYQLNGDFKKIIPLPDYCDNAFHLNDSSLTLFKKVTYSGGKEYKINSYWAGKGGFKLRNKSLRISAIEDERDFAQLTTLYAINDTVCLAQAFSDTIYEIYIDYIAPRYILDFGAKSLPYEFYYDEKLDLREFVLQCKGSDNIWDVNCVMESNNTLFFTFRHSGGIYADIYDKSAGKNQTFKAFNDDVFLQMPEMEITEGFMPIFLDETALYFLVEPYYLREKLKHLESTDYAAPQLAAKEKRPLYRFADDVNPADNPLLLKYTFR